MSVKSLIEPGRAPRLGVGNLVERVDVKPPDVVVWVVRVGGESVDEVVRWYFITPGIPTSSGRSIPRSSRTVPIHSRMRSGS
jgi:hypothetical protein